MDKFYVFKICFLTLLLFGLQLVWGQMDPIQINANQTQVCAGGQANLTANLIQGTINNLACSTASFSGSLTQGVAASNVSAVISYSGGNGGVYDAQFITSSGVSGLTATLVQGNFNQVLGTLNYTISGTPVGSGTATFAISLGGQQCSLNLPVASALWPQNYVHCNPNNPTSIVEVTNPVTGKIWMDRNLGATQVATSSTDVNAYGDLFQWGRRSDGHQCRTSPTTTTISSTDTPPHGNFIVSSNSNFDWRNPQNANLWQGVLGENNPCPYGYRVPTNIELNAERTSWGSNNSTGAFSSPLKLPNSGARQSNTGSLISLATSGQYWSSNVGGTQSNSLFFSGATSNIANNSRANGFAIRCIKETVGSIGALNCGNATMNLISGLPVSGLIMEIPYTGGNGGYYPGSTIASTGVTGLTATISQGLFAISGNLVYSVSGTPNGIGTASFAINIGGKTCTLNIAIVNNPSNQYAIGTVFCGQPTIITDVTNPVTGKTWMDRNLGANRAALNVNDSRAYGSLFQWGRLADGHQCVSRFNGSGVTTSGTTAILSSTNSPNHGHFITPSSGETNWRSTQNNNLWQGVDGVNNPCPQGYRLPTESELNNERLSWVNPTIGEQTIRVVLLLPH